MNKKAVKDSRFLTEYVEQASAALLKTYPKLNKKDVIKVVTKEVEDKLMNPEVKVGNTYTHEAQTSTLLSTLDYVMERKPIIGANATFFKQHSEAVNANAVMLNEFDVSRSEEKKQMFAAEQAQDKINYNIHNNGQLNFKSLSNSWYGGNGLTTSPFYNKECAATTTKTARSVISTAMTTFEAVLANTFTFIDLQEFYTWADVVLKEEVELDEWVVRKTSEDCFNRFIDRVIVKEENDEELMMNYLDNRTSEELTRLYWKYNLMKFTEEHQYIKDLFNVIYGSIRSFPPMKDDNDFSVVPEEYLEQIKAEKSPAKAWKKIREYELFYNPNKAPKSIETPLKYLNELIMKYIYVPFMFSDRMYKLKNFKRNVVTTIDTDSNILSLDPWIEYCFDEVMQGDYGRPYIDNVFININVITYIITQVISTTLDLYGIHSNVAKDYRWRYQMKNEFFFSKLILANVKKRYLNKMVLREGNLLVKPKYDIKGYDFRKASTSDETANFYLDVVKNELLEKDDIDVVRILNIMKQFRKDIKVSLMEGDTKYLPLGSPKELAAYDDPRREQSIRGTFAWNALYPNDQITLPAKVSILKTVIYNMDIIKGLKETNPRIYNTIDEVIFHDKTGMFVKTSSDKEKIEGLSVIAIPSGNRIPDWIIPYIDYTTVVNAVLAPFKSVTETFGIPSIEEGPTGRKSVGFSNIVKL
jgi:hypothetical protein